MYRKTLIFFMLALIGCTHSSDPSSQESNDLLMNNSLSNLSNQHLGDFKWLNEPEKFDIKDGTLTVTAYKGTDFFNNPEDGSITSTAPLLYKEVSGDFVVQALVQPDFSSLWNAVALMIHIDNDNWIKFAFENSDATGRSMVSVVTKGVSDDANGVVLTDQDRIWLKVVRKNNIYSMHWSLDGHNFKMTRLTNLPPAASVKVGVEFQCPVGNAATHVVEYFGIEKRTVLDLRKGK